MSFSRPRGRILDTANAMANHYYRCACLEWSRCTCKKDTRSKGQKYADEVRTFDRKMKRR
jgi:hypothetical protein